MPPLPRQIQHIREALTKDFKSLIDMSDVNGSSEEIEVHFLSRALAALIARKLTDCSTEAAAHTLVDGKNDLGIDAVAVSDNGTRLWLIQSKWSNAGRASFNLAEALKFGQGLDLLDQKRFHRFNNRMQDRAGLIESSWDNSDLRVTLVVVILGPGPIASHASDHFRDLLERYNDPSLPEVLSHETWNIQNIWQVIRENNVAPPIEITAKLRDWIRVVEPFEAYQGYMPVGDVAEWFDTHRERLFSQNIRESLGLTRVNRGMLETLTTSPEDFWYFNNGITVLCDSAERRNWSRGTKGPIDVDMFGASVVNGAQTVTSISRAMQIAPDTAGDAYVSVKIVKTENTPTDFGMQVTQATNTQNAVTSQDFVALDQVQWEIREDFAMTLHKKYTFKRGELEPAPDDGVSVTTAALALACAHSDVALTARAKSNLDNLWERDSQGAYTLLFKSQTPSSVLIWRSAQVLRAVNAWLTATQDRRDGRANSIATSGDLLVAHLVFRNLAMDSIDDDDFDWNAELDRIPELAASALAWLIHQVDASFGPTSVIKNTFLNEDRCRTLARHVLANMASGRVLPELPSDYVPSQPEQRRRRPNAVQTLVNSGRIAEGTPLHFVVRTQSEHGTVDPWLDSDPKRGRATWVNQRSRPLLWEYDGQQYSPSGLVNKIWQLSGWQAHHVSVQGPDRWEIPGQGLLWEIAWRIQDEEEAADVEQGWA